MRDFASVTQDCEHLRKQLQQTTESLDRSHNTIGVKEVVIRDLTDQVTELKLKMARNEDQLGTLLALVTTAEQEAEKERISNKQLGVSLEERDRTIAYISSEVNTLKEHYRNQFQEESRKMQEQHAHEVHSLRRSLEEAAATLGELERIYQNALSECTSLKGKMENMHSEFLVKESKLLKMQSVISALLSN